MSKPETTAEDKPPLMLDRGGRLILGRDTPRYMQLMKNLDDEYERLRQEKHHDR